MDVDDDEKAQGVLNGDVALKIYTDSVENIPG